MIATFIVAVHHCIISIVISSCIIHDVDVDVGAAEAMRGSGGDGISGGCG